MTTQIHIAERTDRHNDTYYTAIVATPSGRGFMAADLIAPTGRDSGQRYRTRRGLEHAIEHHNAHVEECRAIGVDTGAESYTYNPAAPCVP